MMRVNRLKLFIIIDAEDIQKIPTTSAERITYVKFMSCIQEEAGSLILSWLIEFFTIFFLIDKESNILSQILPEMHKKKAK